MERQATSRLLVRAGFVLFVLALLTGLVIPLYLNPRMALAAHLTGVLNGLVDGLALLNFQFVVGSPPPGPPWDVRLVTDEEFDVIRRYLEREQQLTHEAATKLASSIAVRLRPRVSGAPPTVDDRTFVRGVYAFRSFGSA